MEKDGLPTNWGDMPTSLALKVAEQLPTTIVVQFHNNGEPLLYKDLGLILPYFRHQIRCLDTNGKLLYVQKDALIDNMDTITISVIEKDPEADEQYEIVKKFLEIKGDRKPRIVYRLLGEVENAQRWHELPGIVATRILHSPMGSFQYTKKTTIPEIGICVEALTHLAIDRFGNVSMCVRFDPEGKNIIGNINEMTLEQIWNSDKRKNWIQMHIDGKRNDIPLCSRCDYWGYPRGV